MPKRIAFSADYTAWVDTIAEGRSADTNKAFMLPTEYSIKVNTQDAEYWTRLIAGQFLLKNQ